MANLGKIIKSGAKFGTRLASKALNPLDSLADGPGIIKGIKKMRSDYQTGWKTWTNSAEHKAKVDKLKKSGQI